MRWGLHFKKQWKEERGCPQDAHVCAFRLTRAAEKERVVQWDETLAGYVPKYNRGGKLKRAKFWVAGDMEVVLDNETEKYVIAKAAIFPLPAIGGRKAMHLLPSVIELCFPGCIVWIDKLNVCKNCKANTNTEQFATRVVVPKRGSVQTPLRVCGL